MLLKIFKTGKLIFREIEKEILLKGVNNNNNNEVYNSSNYNKKEYERLAKAIKIFKINRDKEIEMKKKKIKMKKKILMKKKKMKKVNLIIKKKMIIIMKIKRK